MINPAAVIVSSLLVLAGKELFKVNILESLLATQSLRLCLIVSLHEAASQLRDLSGLHTPI